VRPDPIDSTKKLLSPPEIMMEFLRRYDTGEYPMQVAMVAMAEELNMDDAEAIQFGNTAFISHYSDEDPLVYMRALNVDTAPNFVDNIENYVSYVYRRGIKTIVTNYSDPVVSMAIKTAHRRIEQNNKSLEADLKFEQDEGETVATITLTKEAKE
jgi:hypothetical protein